ncbi:hypothetical protein CHS0354_001024 [Potamilus streckersoni]|uniref:Uncharacterized protein n=1 Tax=Potamilus streckersoni TaxID=2493646 RepID=A0AAE0RUW3_9BIVA|nr:hypothetical protein CHS0354_001024 [Potamilus streckersoni]
MASFVTVVVLQISLFSLADGMALHRSVILHCNSDDGSTETVRSRLRTRDDASDRQTIWLHKGEELNIGFSLSKDGIVDVKDVRYSNDGGQDRIKLTLDDEELGDFLTRSVSGSGNAWNIFWSSGPIGKVVPVDAGQHLLSLKVDEADEYGVEIDYISFEVSGSIAQELQQERFICKHKN